MSFDPASYPYSTVVYITDTIGGQVYQGSGVLISPDEVLTASHVVYNSSAGTANYITVIPGYSAGSEPYGSDTGNYVQYFPIADGSDSESLATIQQDYAVIHLQTPMTAPGTMGIEWNYPGGSVNVTGFPAIENGLMTESTITVTPDAPYTIFTGNIAGALINHGSSGGPVWIEGSNGPEIVGLVNALSGTVGYFMQITTAVVDQIETWIATDDTLFGQSIALDLSDSIGPVVTNTTGVQSSLTAPYADSTIEGAGYDILNLSQNPMATLSSAYTETSNHNGTFKLATNGSSDLVSGIMQVEFSNKTVTVAADGSENEYIALLYQGALGRTPDAAGLAYWEQIATALPSAAQSLGPYGLSDYSGNYNGSLSIAGGFTNSAEFIAKYGALTNQQYVTQLYANILDRAPDTAGLNSWVSQLNSGVSREHVLAGFADSLEAINNATLGFTGQNGAHAAWLFLT